MTDGEANNLHEGDPHADGGLPNEDSIENVHEELGDIDEQLLRAGHGGHLSRPGEARIDDQELRRRIRDRVNELINDDVEAPPEDLKKIRDFLATLRIRGAQDLSNQEIEVLWANVMRNPSLVEDFTFKLALRKTRNYYSEFPLLPNARDLLEFSDDLKSDPKALRPKVISDAADNLEVLGIDPDEATSIMTGGKGEGAARAMRLLGWVAGFPIMRGATIAHRQHTEAMELDTMTMISLAEAFIVMIDEQIKTVKGRVDKAYLPDFRMDRDALETHDEVLNALLGIQDLLFETFINYKQPR